MPNIRKPRPALRLALWFGLAIFTFVPARAMLDAGLVIAPETKLRLTDRNQADFEVGAVNALDTTQLEHTFTLRNEGITQLVITQLQPSCHCTSVTVEKIASQKPASTTEAFLPLAPGDELELKITVMLARQAPGPFSHGVFISANGFDGIIARAQITGILENGLSVTPDALDFGPMKPGETYSKEITLTYDTRLTSAGALPAIQVQCDPRLSAKDPSIIEVTQETSLSSTDSPKTTSTLRTKTYLVTLRPKQPGDIVAHLFFPPLAPATYKGSLPFDTAADAFRALSISIYGQVMK